MDRITPIDLERHEFNTQLRGYERGMVRAVLSKAATEIATLLTEMKDYKAENERLRLEVEGFRAQEHTLREALLLAQRAADDTRTSAHKEAGLILEDARSKAVDLKRQAEDELCETKQEIARLAQTRRRMEREIRNLLEGYLAEITAESPEITSAEPKLVIEQ